MLSVVFLLVFAPMLVEAARANRNERTQRARGGVEPDGDVYALMRIAYPAAFAAMIAENALGGTRLAPELFAAGLGVFAIAKALKWWAIFTLGPLWTFRVIVLPGTTRVSRGPYRFLSHPNYVGVVGELVGVALMTRAVVAGPIAIVGFGALILKRISIETRALLQARGKAPDAILR